MTQEELQRLAILVDQAVQNPQNSEAETLRQVRVLHPDERVLGTAIWATRRANPTPATASAWFVQCMGQAGADDYDIGDFQRLLNDLGTRPDLGQLAVSGGLVWNHSMESLAERLGRELLLVDLATLAPPLRQALAFFMMRAGFLSANDLKNHDVEPLFESLIMGWEDAQVFSRDWLHRTPSPEVGQFMARALANVAWSRLEPLALAAPFVHADEAIHIALNMKEMSHAPAVIDLLDGRREDVFLALNGRDLAWHERMFGPSAQSWFFGVTGILGPPGLLGVIIALAAYQWVGHLSLPWMIVVMVASAAVVRFLIQKPVPPGYLPEDLERIAARPGASAVLAAWFIRQRRLMKLDDPPDWVAMLRHGAADHSLAWTHLLIAVSDLLPASELTDPSLPEVIPSHPLQIFHDLEFGAAAERNQAHEQLIRHARAERLEPSEMLDHWFADTASDLVAFTRHLENTWLNRRRVTPPTFRATWAAKSLWPVSTCCLFGVYNGYNELVLAFRIDETGELVDVDDQNIMIPGYHTIGLVEPNALTRSDAQRWSSVFADYELVSPFEQFQESPVQLPMALSKSALKSLTQAGWLVDEDGFSLRRPVWMLGITAYIEVDPPLLDSSSSQLIAFDFADGLHFMPESVVTFLRADDEIDRLTPYWLAELRRLAGH